MITELYQADNCSESVALDPVATSAVAASPQILVDASGELPEDKTLDGIAILKLLFYIKNCINWVY